MQNTKPGSERELISSNQIDRFDRLAEEYDAYHDDTIRLAGGDGDYFYQAKINLIVARLDRLPSRIFDFGCGTGRLTAFLAKSFPDAAIFGFDPSEESIKVAEKTCARSPNVFLSASLDSIEGSFDMAVASGVFHHIPGQAWKQNVAVVASHLISNAPFFVFEHNPLSLALRFLLWLEKCDQGAELVYPWRMQTLLRGADFKNVECEFISFFPSYLGPLLRLERWMTRIPFGAQYLVWGLRDKKDRQSNEN